MFLKPDYNLKIIYDIDLEKLKNSGIKALLFDLDSTLMKSKSGEYDEKTIDWLKQVNKDFFVGIVSNNCNKDYIEKVMKVTTFPIVFNAGKPDVKVAKKFMEEYNLSSQKTV